jgi:hypothetical protein
MRLNLRKLSLTEEIDYNFIKHALSEYKNPRVKINGLLKSGQIIRVKKGLYIFGSGLRERPFSKETLANLIYGPSYISLEYALSFYGLIPERVEVVTCITNKRQKYFTTPVGSFSYQYINPSIYAQGITLHEIDRYHSILIATREKAIADILYFNEKIENEWRLEEYLLQNLRVEKESLATFNLNRVKKLTAFYGHNVILFRNLLRSYK